MSSRQLPVRWFVLFPCTPQQHQAVLVVLDQQKAAVIIFLEIDQDLVTAGRSGCHFAHDRRAVAVVVAVIERDLPPGAVMEVSIARTDQKIAGDNEWKLPKIVEECARAENRLILILSPQQP